MKLKNLTFGWLGLAVLLSGCTLALGGGIAGVSGFSQEDRVPDYLESAWLCLNGSGPLVDDLTTAARDSLRCELDLEFTDTSLIVRANGIPNHDFESSLGCCAREQNYAWSIPLNPVEDTDGSLAMAPERGPIAVAVNGAAIYGPEDGPGSDAVALDQGYFVENRQRIELGVCGGHSEQQGHYHYHWDANCMHWHGSADGGIENYDFAQVDGSEHSQIIGFAFDGYPIYGLYGYDASGSLAEMTSSYRLKASGGNGYNGIDDWEYVAGLGDLDECNGHFGPTPEAPEGIYHYHSTRVNGAGGLGFPYFLLCYHGVADAGNFNPGGQGNGPGGPPPPPGR